MWDELQALKAHLKKLEALNGENAMEIRREESYTAELEREVERLVKRVETLEALNKTNLDALQERKGGTDLLARQVERLTELVEGELEKRGTYYIKEYEFEGNEAIPLVDDVVCVEISYVYDYGNSQYGMPRKDFHRKKGSDGSVLVAKTDKRISGNGKVAYEGKIDKIDVTNVLNDFCKDYPCSVNYRELFDDDFLKRNGMDDHAPKVIRILYKSHMGLTTQPSRMKYLGHSYVCPSYSLLYARVKNKLRETRSQSSVEPMLDSLFKEHIVLVGDSYYEKIKETKMLPQFAGRLVPKYHRVLDNDDGWSELQKKFG